MACFPREPSCSLCTCKPWISIGNSYTCGSHLKCASHNVVFFFFSFLPNTTTFQSAVPYLLLSSIKTGTSVWCDHLSFMVQSFIAAFQLLCLGWGFVTQSESDQTLSLSCDPWLSPRFSLCIFNCCRTSPSRCPVFPQIGITLLTHSLNCFFPCSFLGFLSMVL